MSRFPVLGAFIGILICLFSTVAALNYRKAIFKVLQERRAEYAVNYAVDAAVRSVVEGSSDLDLDYERYYSLAAGPDVALETFLLVFCKNYGFPLTEAGYAIVKNDYLPMFMVATYDGYYIAEQQKINDLGGHDLVFSMKQPYLYKDDAGKLYGLNLGYIDAKRIDSGIFYKVDAPISEQQQRLIINSTISDSIMQVLMKRKAGELRSHFYLPSDATNIVNTNPVKGVTVMAYVEGINVGYGRSSDVFGIGGARVTRSTYCVAYTKAGQKLYTFEHLVPDGIVSEATYVSAQEAAAAGYYFDNATLSE